MGLGQKTPKILIQPLDSIGTLADVLATSPDLMSSLVISGGRIAEWPQVLVAAPGEDPDWDTPRVDVEWSGFVDAVRDAARRARVVWSTDDDV